MNGVHDMGGTHGLGPVAPETDEPVFHHAWEGRAHALVIASPTRGNIDAGRHQRELIPGPDYLRMSYYEKWFTSLCALLLKSGLVTPAELADGRAAPGGAKRTPRFAAADVTAAMINPSTYIREVAAGPAFKPGDRVRARHLNPTGHTRLPRYARGHVGVIERWHRAHVLPDSNAHGRGENPEWVYTVVFDGAEIWGEGADPTLTVSIDAWESYLEPA